MRFKFGDNWLGYLKNISQEKIDTSRRKLKEFLSFDLKGKTFLDVGCGSGVHSYAAVLEGAIVHSFDYDVQSVQATQSIREKFKISSEQWIIEQGDALNQEYLGKVEKHDIVYSWGVLHHTGNMWSALDNLFPFVKVDGHLFIAIYNDQGVKSKFWWYVKYIYNVIPSPLNKVYGYVLGTLFQGINILKYTILLKPMDAIRPLIDYKKNRGMTIFHDMIDWIGGFPFEYASYERLKNFYTSKGFQYVKGNKASSLGCHELVFKKVKFS